MNLNNIDYFIYSSHKKLRQTLLETLKNNNYNSIHVHSLLKK